MCDAQIATNRGERRNIGHTMNQQLAGRTDTGNEPGRRRFGDVVHDVEGRSLWRSTANAIDFTRAARLLARLLCCQKVTQITLVNEERSFLFDKREAALNPSAYGELMHAQKLRGARRGLVPLAIGRKRGEENQYGETD